MPEPSDNTLQERNRSWWERNAMNYDWRRTLQAPEGSAKFFAEIDRRFFSSSPFYRGERPFAELIPFEKLKGARVLEIGCGMGSHAQLFCEAGAELSAIDLTQRAVEQTRRRLEIAHLTADVRQADAERLPFPDNTFDFVWSWGVIHHSADPEAILRETLRVLRPGAPTRIMVYNRRSIEAFGKLVRGVLSGKRARGMTTDEILSAYSDGYVARHYTGWEFKRMLERAGFVSSRTQVLGQTIEMVPLPGGGAVGAVKRALLRVVPDGLTRAVLSRWGWFLVARAQKAPPLPPR